MRFLFLVKCPEGDGPPPKSFMDFMGNAATEAFQAGTMIDTGGLAPSAMSTRVRLEGGRVNILDGPFSEAKEVIGGYAIMELPSREEACQSAKWLMDSHREHWPGWEGEVEVRQMLGPDDFEQICR